MIELEYYDLQYFNSSKTWIVSKSEKGVYLNIWVLSPLLKLRFHRVFFKNGVVQHMSGEDRYM